MTVVPHRVHCPLPDPSDTSWRAHDSVPHTCPGFLFFLFFFLEEEALHVSQICHRSNSSGQLEETSGSKANTARPTTGEAALPWQTIRV